MKLDRRRFLALSGGLGLAAVMAGCAPADSSGQTAALLRSRARLPKPFTVPLPIPPVKKPVAPGRYDVVQKAADVEILPGLTTPIMGYDGIFPGPTFDVRRGEAVVVRHHNTLPVPTVVHLHGGTTPSASDGYPTDLVLPTAGAAKFTGPQAMLGEVVEGDRDYAYPLDQRASTLWYHDHRMDFSGPQVWRGLAGFWLIRDDVEDSLPLPAGDRELPLMITDRAFAADGSFRYPSLDPSLVDLAGVTDEFMEGVLGDVVLVNGAPWPVVDVDAARYRLRLLNASNARRYALRLDPLLSMVQIGSDGGLLAAPVAHDVVVIAPAERFDVIVDFSTVPVGSTVTLRNQLGEGGTANVMRFRVVRKATDDSAVPDVLSAVPALVSGAAAPERTWRFTNGAFTDHHGEDHKGWVINGLPFEPGRIDAKPRLGEVEVWRFFSDLHHSIHIHLSPFQVLSRGGKNPSAYDGGWKDTVDLRPSEYVDVAVRFEQFTGKFMLHCHNLEHEDMAMMTNFQTIA